MKRFAVATFLLALLLGASGHEARAQGTRSWFVCGGTTFNTCAAVMLEVGPADIYGVSQVRMNVWNMSGLGDTYGGTVFTKIGFYNTGSVVALTEPPLEMAGPTREGDAPESWVIGDPNNAGGVMLDLAAASSGQNSNVNNGIANDCDPEALPGGRNELWQNPCVETADMLPTLSDDGWITMTFSVRGDWELATTELLVMGQNGPDGMSTQCITGTNCSVVPEPSTWILLGSGLAGLALFGLRRRREQEGSVELE